MATEAKLSQTARIAYAERGSQQFKSSYDYATGQFRGLNEAATVLFSDPARTKWIAVAPWAIAEGEVVHLDGQRADFRVTWAQAQAQSVAA